MGMIKLAREDLAREVTKKESGFKVLHESA
jgi:hypothetical protein